MQSSSRHDVSTIDVGYFKCFFTETVEVDEGEVLLAFILPAMTHLTAFSRGVLRPTSPC
jgi:hypothetical protein